MASLDQEKALTAWANTTLGILLYWWHANKQQAGRGSIGVTALRTLPVLDVASLSTKQLQSAASLSDEIKTLELKPINEIGVDQTRRALDERFLVEVLGMPVAWASAGGPLVLFRQKLAMEPSITGSKTVSSTAAT